MHKIKRDDLVKVIAGKDRDKQGKVLHVDTKNNKVLVEGCNMITKHVKPGPEKRLTNSERRNKNWLD